MGRPKLLLTYRGVPLLSRAVDAAAGAGCSKIIVVLGANADEYRPLLNGTGARVVLNKHYAEGMSGSIQLGVEAVGDDVDAAIIMLADQPFIDAAIIRSLIEAYKTSGKKIVACQYGTVKGVPALFDRALFLELLLVTGDLGARSVMETYPGHLTTVVIPIEAAADVDRPEDLERLKPM